MSVKIVINRIIEGQKSTISHCYIKNNDYVLFTFVALELANLHNKKNISSIPSGTYKAEVIRRQNGQLAILLHEVPNRSSILIHLGNYYTDIKGCILVGEYLHYINNDAFIDVANSTKTMEKLIEHCPEQAVLFDVEINKINC